MTLLADLTLMYDLLHKLRVPVKITQVPRGVMLEFSGGFEGLTEGCVGNGILVVSSTDQEGIVKVFEHYVPPPEVPEPKDPQHPN